MIEKLINLYNKKFPVISLGRLDGGDWIHYKMPGHVFELCFYFKYGTRQMFESVKFCGHLTDLQISERFGRGDRRKTPLPIRRKIHPGVEHKDFVDYSDIFDKRVEE